MAGTEHLVKEIRSLVPAPFLLTRSEEVTECIRALQIFVRKSSKNQLGQPWRVNINHLLMKQQANGKTERQVSPITVSGRKLIWLQLMQNTIVS